VINTLVIPFWKSCPSPGLRLLGIKFKDRIALQSRRSGFESLVLPREPGGIEQLPEEFLIFFPNLLLTDSGWKQLNALEPASDTLTMISGTDSFALVRCRDADFIAGAFQKSDSYSDLLDNLGARLKRGFVSVGKREWISFESEADSPLVEKWMLHGLIKDSEGFMSRHLERKISLAVTRRLAKTRLTPNAMTLVSVVIGIIGASFFALPQGPYHILGSLLFWIHSILDGCDGELARLKFAESRWGGLLDFWGDNLVHSAVFSAIAAGMSLNKPGSNLLPLAASAVGGTLVSATFVYWTTLRPKRSGGPLFASISSNDERFSSPGTKIADLLARRDFIYLVVALALLRKMDWFLWMGAVGAPMYFLALAGFSLKNSSARPNKSCFQTLQNERTNILLS
jgi:phosphatidylglycerophosphate synthase